MRKVDQYILGTLVKTAAGTTALCTLMLVSVQMFQHLDAFLRNQTPLKDLLRLAVLYVPSCSLRQPIPSASCRQTMS